MALLEISVIPIGTNTASFSSSVVDAVKLIKESGLPYQITPTATIIEGETSKLLEVAEAIHNNVIASGVNRVVTNISIDERMDKSINMEQQIDIVQQSLH